MVLMVVLMLVLASLAVCAVILFTSGAILFSRVACALLAALVASQGDLVLVADSGFLNYVAWASVCIGVIYLFTLLPRVDMALRFFCTIFMSVFLIEVLVTMCGGIFAAIKGSEFQLTGPWEILIKAVCLLFSLGSMIIQGKRTVYEHATGKLMDLLERLGAAVLYGVSILFLSVSLTGNWEIPEAVGLLIFLVATGAVALFHDRLIEALFPPEEVTVVPR